MRHREPDSINTAIAAARAELALQHSDPPAGPACRSRAAARALRRAGAWRIIRPNGQLSLECWQHYKEARECLCALRTAFVLKALDIVPATYIPTGMRLRDRVNWMIEAAGYRIRAGSCHREAAAARERLRAKPLTNRRSRRGSIGS